MLTLGTSKVSPSTRRELCRNDSRKGFKANLIELVVVKEIHETTEATSAVSTHFSFTAVGVVVTHFEIRTFCCGFHEEESVGSNSSMAIAEFGDLAARESERKIAVIKHDEVIACAVHFPEM